MGFFQSFLNLIGSVSNRFHKPQPNTWSDKLMTAVKPKTKIPYLNAQDEATIQKTIRNALIEAGESWMVPDSAVNTLAKDIVNDINSKH